MMSYEVLFEQMKAAGLNDFAGLVQNDPDGVADQWATQEVRQDHIADWAQLFDLHLLKVHRTSPETAERDLEFKLAALELFGITGRAVPGIKSLEGHESPKEKKVKKQGKVVGTISAGSKNDEGEGSPSEPHTVETLREPVEVPQRYSKVMLSFGITKSLVNFEFARIDVGAEDFCAPEDKDEAWTNLSLSVGACLEKLIGEIDTFRAAKSPIKTPPQAPTTPPLVAPLEPKKAAGDATFETRKVLHSEIKLLANQGLLVYREAIEKIQNTTLNESFALTLLTALRSNDVSFFKGVIDDQEETDQIDRIDDDV